MPERLYARTLLRRMAGATLDRLHAPVKKLHDVQDATVVFGHTDIDRGPGPISRVVGWLFGFPPAGRRLPTAITILANGGREIWHRRFAGHPILTHLEPAGEARRPVIVERFRFGVTFALQITERDGSLRFELRGMRVCGIPMPRFLWPLLDAEERSERGGFRFDINIALRGFGRLIHYRGWVRPA
jgi:hypothetical protein